MGMAVPLPFRIIASAAAGLALFAQPCFAQGAGDGQYVGVNLAGAEFNAKRKPGKIGKHYAYPSRRDFDYFLGYGFTTFRVPFLWERLQPKLDGGFRPVELKAIDRTVAYATGKGATIILDPHNYARYYRHDIGSDEVPISAFARFWGKFADRYKDNPRVIFGLMNEPHRIRADLWRRAVDAAIAAIRATGARNLILVPGTRWTGAHSWQSPHRGISNAQAFRSLTDPGGNFAFEVHQYFDKNYSGTKKFCSKGAAALAAMERMTKWLRDTRNRGFLGEFGVADSDTCLRALDAVLRHMKENRDVWIGWTYWAAGGWWGNYMFSVHPSKDGKPKPQLEVLRKYTGRP